MTLHTLAPAKVNLFLLLGPVRGDGRHELVTLFESISLADELELTVRTHAAEDEVLCPGVSGRNLAAHALAALRASGWRAPPVRVTITKRIPVAAGLGGGSADAAATLRLADELEPLGEGVAERVARGLGADVPSQLRPGLWLGTGAGELIEPITGRGGHAFAVVPSRHALQTSEVYQEADRLGLGRPAQELAAVAAHARADASLPLGVNDLEEAARSLCPAIDEALEAVRGVGAEQVMVCGSGPTVAGIWWGERAGSLAGAAAAALAEGFPGAVRADPLGAIPGASPRPHGSAQ